VTVVVVASGSWTGAINTDWFNVGNWCGGALPTASTDITIPGGILNFPNINAAGAVCQSITIASGASLTITGANTLTVNGNWSNSGTFTANTSTVTFGGTSAQSILSGGTSFSGLTYSGSATLQLATAVTTSAIFNNSGVVDLNGQALNINNLQGTGVSTFTNNGAAATLAVTNSGTYPGSISNGSGALSISKSGAGTLTLSGNNSYSGTTSVTAGILDVQSNNALGTTAGATTVSSGAAVQVDGNGLSIGDTHYAKWNRNQRRWRIT
jgi:autotransporter-associated beta strand protein